MNGSRHADRKGRFPLLADLRSERIRRGIGLIDVAENIGYHRVTISRWERGIDYPSIAALADWCEALGVNLHISTGQSP